MKRTTTRGFGDFKFGNQKPKIWSDVTDALDMEVADFKLIRPIGGVVAYGFHMVEIETQKFGVFPVPKLARNFNPETDEFDPNIEDPYADLPNTVYSKVEYFANVIDRDLQDEAPSKKRRKMRTKQEKKTGLKDDKLSKSWTPVRVMRCTQGFAKKLQVLANLNKHRVDGKMVPCALADPKYGKDIFVKADKKAESPNDYYKCSPDEKTKLTAEEENYLLWDLTKLFEEMPLEQAQKDAASLEAKAPTAEDYDKDEDEDIGKKKKKKDKKSKKSKGKKSNKGKKGKDKKGKKGKGGRSSRRRARSSRRR